MPAAWYQCVALYAADAIPDEVGIPFTLMRDAIHGEGRGSIQFALRIDAIPSLPRRLGLKTWEPITSRRGRPVFLFKKILAKIKILCYNIGVTPS